MTAKLTHEGAVDFFSALYGGEHHIPGAKRSGRQNVKAWGPESWQVAHYGDLATYDFDTLTRLVILAHDRCIRVALTPCGPRHIRIGITRRSRTDSIFTNHPTIQEAISKHGREGLCGVVTQCCHCGTEIHEGDNPRIVMANLAPGASGRMACLLPGHPLRPRYVCQKCVSEDNPSTQTQIKVSPSGSSS